MPKVIISTLFHAQPVLAAAAKFGADRILLILSSVDTPEQENALRIIQESLGTVVEIKIFKTDVYNIVDVAKTATRIIDTLSEKDTIYVNITGGRKTLSIGLLFAAYKRITQIAKIVYITEEENKVIELPKLHFTLTASQLKVLEAIAAGTHTNLVELADKIQISRAMLYRNIKELQDMGLIADEDGFRLTDAGKIGIL